MKGTFWSEGAEAAGLIAKINDCRISGIERRERGKKGIHRVGWTISNAPYDTVDVSHETSQLPS